jgi:hypothetical protein
MADLGEVVLRQRTCRGCHAVFWICRYCDRGQRYCRAQCRARARREQRRQANRRHQQSPYGREDHRDRQREYRKRCAQTRVTDQSSAAVSSPGNMPGWDTRSARSAAQAPSTAASVLSLTLPAWRKHSQQHRVPFLCCVLCGRRGRFVDPFPTIPRFRRP